MELFVAPRYLKNKTNWFVSLPLADSLFCSTGNIPFSLAYSQRALGDRGGSCWRESRVPLNSLHIRSYRDQICKLTWAVFFVFLLSKFALSSVLKLESLRKPDVISAFIYLFFFWMEAICYHPDFPRCAGKILLPKKKRKWIQSRSIRNTFNKNEKSH